jgi:hypothetical protein
VAEASREREQPFQDLRNLFIVDERPECKACDDTNAQAKLDAVEDLDVKNRTRPKTVGSQKVDKVCRCQVKVDMLETEQSGEDNATR